MRKKYVWWSLAAVVTAGAVGTTAALGVITQREYADLGHGQAFALNAPQAPVEPVSSEGEHGNVDRGALRGRLDAVANESRLGNFGGQVIDTTDGQVVWDREADKALLPASSTKVLTSAAAVLELGEDHRVETTVVREPGSDAVVIQAGGDVWLDAERLDDLAAQISRRAAESQGGEINTVLIDVSAWEGPDQAEGWDPGNVDGGFSAPMQPAMLYGARLGSTSGDVPRSHQPALDVARALAGRLGAQNVQIGSSPQRAEEIAAVESAPLSVRNQQMVKFSDNVAAEAIGRELAAARGLPASFSGATQATLDVLRESGIDTNNVRILDNSGLSERNRIPARVLSSIIAKAVADENWRPVTGYLPVAGGEGTLNERYGNLPGQGYVRAKTGTLTSTSALVGTAVGQSGRIYAFAFLVNNGEILPARAGQDALASTLRQF